MFIVTFKEHPKDTFTVCELLHDPEDAMSFYSLALKSKHEVHVFKGESMAQERPRDFAA